MIEIALYRPDIAPNAATIVRFAACLGLTVRIIEPAGFTWSDSSFRRAAMDYADQATVIRHASWQAFLDAAQGRRIVLMTTRSALPYAAFAFEAGDILLYGRESAGVPEAVHQRADARLLIPMKEGLRSINVALACAMTAGEALRQLDGFPAVSGRS
jgi:tRNA (cytidine/uridine-2'-O-)-methyltransferase